MVAQKACLAAGSRTPHELITNSLSVVALHWQAHSVYVSSCTSPIAVANGTAHFHMHCTSLVNPSVATCVCQQPLLTESRKACESWTMNLPACPPPPLTRHAVANGLILLQLLTPAAWQSGMSTPYSVQATTSRHLVPLRASVQTYLAAIAAVQMSNVVQRTLSSMTRKI